MAKAKTNFPVEDYAAEIDQLTSVPFSDIVKQLREAAYPAGIPELEPATATPSEPPLANPQHHGQLGEPPPTPGAPPYPWGVHHESEGVPPDPRKHFEDADVAGTAHTGMNIENIGNMETVGHGELRGLNPGTGVQAFTHMGDAGIGGNGGMPRVHPGMDMAYMGMPPNVATDIQNTGACGTADVENTNTAAPRVGMNVLNMPSNSVSAHPSLDMASMGIFSGIQMHHMRMAPHSATNMQHMAQQGFGGRQFISGIPQAFAGSQTIPAIVGTPSGHMPGHMGRPMRGFGEDLAHAGELSYGLAERSDALAATCVEAAPFDELAKKLRAGGDVARLVPQGPAVPSNQGTSPCNYRHCRLIARMVAVF
jgi:hypothetical protein